MLLLRVYAYVSTEATLGGSVVPQVVLGGGTIILSVHSVDSWGDVLDCRVPIAPSRRNLLHTSSTMST